MRYILAKKQSERIISNLLETLLSPLFLLYNSIKNKQGDEGSYGSQPESLFLTLNNNRTLLS